MNTPNLSAAVVAKPSLTEKDIECAKQAIKTLIDHNCDCNSGDIASEAAKTLSEIIKIRLMRFVVTSSGVVVGVEGNTNPHTRCYNFALHLELYGYSASAAIQLSQAADLLLKDNFARSIAHNLLANAAVAKWGL